MQVLERLSRQDFQDDSHMRLQTDELCPWESSNTRFISSSGELFTAYKFSSTTESNGQIAPVKRRKPKRHSQFKTYEKPFVNVQSLVNCEATLTAAISPRMADQTKSIHCEPVNTEPNFSKDDIQDKQNILRLKQCIVENRRNQRLEKVVKIMNPRRTQSILMERSRLRSILKEETNEIKKQTPRYNATKKMQKTCVERHHSRDCLNAGPTLNRYGKASSHTHAQLKFLPEITKRLYEKYSLNKTKTSFRNRRIV